ncbi:hypothetical protein [Microcystis phage Mae-JY09]
MGKLIIGRETWQARPPRSVSRCAYLRNTLFVHHSTGAAPTSSMAAECQWMRNIQAFHMGPSRGWSDFAYNFAISPAGRIYEGRGANVWGAHTVGHNDEPAVCLMGDYSRQTPTLAMRDAVWWLADHLGMTELDGHRDVNSTSCPGDEAMVALVNAPRSAPPKTDPAPLPHSNTLRLVVNGRAWAGWDQARNPLINISRKGLKPTADAAIAWKGEVWRGSTAVTNVAKSLVRTHGLD